MRQAAFFWCGAVFDCAQVGGGERSEGRDPNRVCRCCIQAAGDGAESVGEALRAELPFESEFRSGVLGRVECGRTQHVLRVIDEILVDLDGAVARLQGLQLEPRLGLFGNSGLAALEKQQVGGDIGAGIRAEGAVGKAHGGEEVGFGSDIFADGAVLFVERVAAGDQSQQTTGPHEIDGLGEEVVMNGTGQGGVLFVA